MSYYNFDEHFWSAKLVCHNQELQTPTKTKVVKNQHMPILYMLCVAIGVALLWQILLIVKNNNQEGNLTDINNGDCLMIKSNTGMQLYCSKL